MVGACLPYGKDLGLFITPMAAVAGSVADEIVLSFRKAGIDRAYVNNGGDIALHLTPGQQYDVGVVTRLQTPGIDGRFRQRPGSPTRARQLEDHRELFGRTRARGCLQGRTRVGHCASSFSRASARPSMSPCVRRSVTATSRQSPRASYQRPSAGPTR